MTDRLFHIFVNWKMRIKLIVFFIARQTIKKLPFKNEITLQSCTISVFIIHCNSFFLQLHRDVVVYVTKVEVQQSGGVTIVGDEAKIHHHYQPES